MRRRWRFTPAARVIAVCVALCAHDAFAAREAVLKQIDLPHAYYFREMYLPQLTSGPSSVTFSPDGQTLVYSMAGSLWQQRIGDDTAVELTHGPGYDYQPDWSSDGRYVVFARHARNAIELWHVDVQTKRQTQLTTGGAVNLQPRYSPDGKRLAFVSTSGTGHFDLYVADVNSSRLGTRKSVVTPRQSRIPRYYYSTYDHAIDPSWTPDGKRIVFVSNREVAYGSGNLCSVAASGSEDPTCFMTEETSWRAQPVVGPDGRRVLYSSYEGRQWHQLWLTTLKGEPPLPLTFGEFDITQARWSPDGSRIAYISNEAGNTSLWVHEMVGGARQQVVARQRATLTPMVPLRVRASDTQGRTVSARFRIFGSDGRHYGPDDKWLHADDGFDPQRQPEETRYFHCASECSVTVPLGATQITAWRGQEFAPVERTLQVANENAAQTFTMKLLTLPAWAPAAVTADMHVHMNYGGNYRQADAGLADQAAAEDLDIVYNTLVNKEQRVPDVLQFTTTPFVRNGVTIFQSQEYHTSYWGHLGLLHTERYLSPGFTAYQHTALASPYPHNGVIADLAHRQKALVGYVHPYDWEIVPESEKTLTHMFPVDVAHGKVDYVEVVGFADHKATAAVWYKLLNLGFKVPTGSGTDAMTNYASLRGPVGMNRVYLHSRESTSGALIDAVKNGRTVASNGPQLALQAGDKNIGDTLNVATSGERVRFRAAMRSPAPMDHLEVIHNGKVVASHRFGKERTQADFTGEIALKESGWILLRAWNDQAHPLIMDIYPYATTSPIYVTVGDKPARSPVDAAYFVSWLHRVIESVNARDDFNNAGEKQATLDYLKSALAEFQRRAR